MTRENSYPGVTFEKNGGVHKRNGFTIQATDLPGTYSSRHGHEHGVTLVVPPELGTQYTS